MKWSQAPKQTSPEQNKSRNLFQKSLRSKSREHWPILKYLPSVVHEPGARHRWGPVRSQPSPTDSELESAFYELPKYLWLVQTCTQTQDYGECVPSAAAGPSVLSIQYLKQVQWQVQVCVQNAPLNSPVFKEDIPHT